ncbi:MAG TPA: GH25 family lysozyme [Pseudonocardiaceae bacterium]|nr:GH25 family lysozyme [Pseudonocardiaceae bacterium]
MTPPSGVPGIDVSHFQGTLDWPGIAANGIKFAYIKATEGATFVDPNYATNFAGADAAGVLRGGYHFALPDQSSGAAQAKFFLVTESGWVADGGNLPPVLDIENNPYQTPTDGECYGLSPSQTVSWLADFSNTVHAETNRWPVVYTTAKWWSDCTGGDTTLGAHDPLWIASPNPTVGVLPVGWSSYTFWQYGVSGSADIPPSTDEDVFNGADLQALTSFATGDGNDMITLRYNQMGGAGSHLGTVVGYPVRIGSGWERQYQGGVIFYYPPTGAHAVLGKILAHYQQLGGPTGFLGFPITDETPTPDTVGRYNHFADSGSIYWTPATGAWSIHGAIRDKWSALGWERSALGYPTSDESGTADGVARYNTFAGTGGSAIYWTSASGAREVQGAIYGHWTALGGEAAFGYPTTDETGTPDGVGRFNHFSKDASVYWSPGSDVWSVHGAIRDAWAGQGWERGRLGYPTSDEYGVAGGRRNNFQHGTITWYSASNTIQITYS